MTIRNKRDLRIAYELLAAFKRYGANPAALAELKRDVRGYYKRLEARRACRPLIFINCGFDGYIELLAVPAGVDPADYFENDVRMEYRPTYYDCTGQAFTTGHKFTTWNGAPVIIHHVGIDV